MFFWLVWLFAASFALLITIGAGAWILCAVPTLTQGRFRASLGEVIILGLGVLYVVFSIMHFMLPLSYGLGAAALLAAGGLLVQRKNLPLLIRERPDRSYPLGFLLVFLSMSAFVFLSYPEFDSGLYHFQTILWYFEQPLVLGLANLHFRLGFNSAESLWGAGFLIDKDAYWMALLPNVALLTGFGWAVIDRVYDLKQTTEQRLSTTFVAMLPIGLMMADIDKLAASLGGNTGAAVLFCILVMSVIVLAAVPRPLHKEESAPAALILLLATCAVLIKITAAAAAIIAVMIAIIQIFRRRTRLKPTLVVIALCSIATLLMITRSYAMNGCLLVFVSKSCIHVPWAISAEYANYLNIEAIAWGRAGGNPTTSGKSFEQWASGYDWIIPLFVRLCNSITAPFINLFPYIEIWIRAGFIIQILTNKAFMVLILFTAVSVNILLRCNNIKAKYVSKIKNEEQPFFQGILIILAGVLFWFFTAPDLRYSTGPRACITAAIITIFFLLPRSEMPSRLAVVCIALLPLSLAYNMPYKLYGTHNQESMAERIFPLPETTLEIKNSADGTMVAVSMNDHCSITPIPCTPYTAGLDKLTFGKIWSFPAIYHTNLQEPAPKKTAP